MVSATHAALYGSYLTNPLSTSFMGRSVIDLPPRVIHEFVTVSENILHWDKYAVVSGMLKSWDQRPAGGSGPSMHASAVSWPHN